MTQFIPEDERPLPALAGFEASVADSLVDLRSTDTGHGAGFRNGKPLAGECWVVIVQCYLLCSPRGCWRTHQKYEIHRGESKLRGLEILRASKPVDFLHVGSNCSSTKGLALAAPYLQEL